MESIIISGFYLVAFPFTYQLFHRQEELIDNCIKGMKISAKYLQEYEEEVQALKAEIEQLKQCPTQNS